MKVQKATTPLPSLTNQRNLCMSIRNRTSRQTVLKVWQFTLSRKRCCPPPSWCTADNEAIYPNIVIEFLKTTAMVMDKVSSLLHRRSWLWIRSSHSLWEVARLVLDIAGPTQPHLLSDQRWRWSVYIRSMSASQLSIPEVPIPVIEPIICARSRGQCRIALTGVCLTWNFWQWQGTNQLMS